MQRFIYLIIGLVLLSNVAFGQQEPVFSQYLYEARFFNPAQMKDGFIGLNYKRQYMDLDARYAPTSYFAIADVSSLLNLSDKNIGLGVKFTGSQSHLLQRNDISVSFAYHLIRGSSQQLSAGINAGFLMQRFDFVDSRINDPFDLELLDGQPNASVFNGGFGLAYHFNPADEHHFFVDVSAPQLFSSDLNFDSDLIWDLVPHLLVRASYRYAGSVVGVEPIVLYRDLIGEQKLKAGNLELGLRVLLLDNRIWFAGGSRLDTESFHGSFGATVYAGLGVFANFEANSLFGNGFEGGIIYEFNKVGIPMPYLKELRKIVKRVKTERNDAIEDFNTVNNSLQELDQQQYDEIAIKEKVRFVEGKLSALKSRGEIINKEQRTANAILEQTVSEQGDNEKLLRKMDKDKATIDQIKNDFEARRIELEYRLASLKEKFLPEIEVLFAQKELSRIQTYYQQKLDQLNEKPEGTMPVVVQTTTTGNAIEIAYQFPKSVEEYNLRSAGLKDVRGLMDHIQEQINTLNAKNIAIKEVNLIAQLRDKPSRWRFNGGNYKGDIGQELNVVYTVREGDGAPKEGKKSKIKTGDLDLEQVNALKLFALKDYLTSEFRKNGIPLPTINLELNGPNEQVSLQVYRIQLIVE